MTSGAANTVAARLVKRALDVWAGIVGITAALQRLGRARRLANRRPSPRLPSASRPLPAASEQSVFSRKDLTEEELRVAGKIVRRLDLETLFLN